MSRSVVSTADYTAAYDDGLLPGTANCNLWFDPISTVDSNRRVIVHTDLNWIRHGYLQAFIRDANQPVSEGQYVTVVDEDGTVVEAYVIEKTVELLKMKPLERSIRTDARSATGNRTPVPFPRNPMNADTVAGATSVLSVGGWTFNATRRRHSL